MKSDVNSRSSTLKKRPDLRDAIADSLHTVVRPNAAETLFIPEASSTFAGTIHAVYFRADEPPLLSADASLAKVRAVERAAEAADTTR